MLLEWELLDPERAERMAAATALAALEPSSLAGTPTPAPAPGLILSMGGLGLAAMLLALLRGLGGGGFIMIDLSVGTFFSCTSAGGIPSLRLLVSGDVTLIRRRGGDILLGLSLDLDLDE